MNDIMKRKTILFILAGFLCCSCNSWLDIKPKLEVEREEVFSSENGFNDVLSGCYALLKNEYLYGKHLTMTSLEYMAQHWQTSDAQQAFRNFNYGEEQAKAIFSGVYSNMYKAIAQANDLIRYLDQQGPEVIKNPGTVKRLKGEALAIRAFCHFDLLRIFGQVPLADATIKVALPYAEVASEERVPACDYDTYKDKVLRDFMVAEKLLGDSDPVTEYTFAELNDPSKLGVGDANEAFRRLKFNYWAVKALMARFYLYTGDKYNAYVAANEVITAKVHGENVLSLAMADDMANKAYTLPSETLMAVHIYDLAGKVEELFDGTAALSATDEKKKVTDDVFLGESTDSRLDLFEEQSIAGSEIKRVTTKKYRQNDEGLGLKGNESVGATDDFVNMQMMPVIRLAECYLIAAEAAPSLQESNCLMKEYKGSRGIAHQDYISFAARETDILNQYQREFWAEGQMFYTYKRKMSKQMLWGYIPVVEKHYVVPLPDGEF